MKLHIKDLTHTYKTETRTILAIDDLHFNAGDQVLLRGVSGSGKTTLFNILAGLLQPTSGEVFIDDQSLYQLPEAQRDLFRARHMGYVFQNHNLLGMLNALENVMMPMAFAHRFSTHQQRQQGLELLEQVGLKKEAHKLPKQLSTGQRLRVGIARALASQPQIILADEPTAALDQDFGLQIMDLLQQYAIKHAAILIVSSHDPQWVAHFNQVFDLRAGTIFTTENVR